MPAQSAYDRVAGEYYDSARHPTCYNFGELSERFLAPRIDRVTAIMRCLEIGAGRSVVAPRLRLGPEGLRHLVLLDHAPEMLAHSREWGGRGARLVVAEAAALPFSAAQFDLVVAGLGDPYNVPPAWQEIARVMSPEGLCLFTAPAAEWAERFRVPNLGSEAEFILGDGTMVAVPSIVLAVEEQKRLAAGAGLRVDEIVAYVAGDLTGPQSKKLDVFGGMADVPVVRGFAIRKA